MCGEQKTSGGKAVDIEGSPPRVRGTVEADRRSCPAPGITPACAGNRNHGFKILIGSGDHPRVCGEQSCATCCGVFPLGSPPRVRGTDSFSVGAHTHSGITPACAGNSTGPSYAELME